MREASRVHCKREPPVSGSSESFASDGLERIPDPGAWETVLGHRVRRHDLVSSSIHTRKRARSKRLGDKQKDTRKPNPLIPRCHSPQFFSPAAQFSVNVIGSGGFGVLTETAARMLEPLRWTSPHCSRWQPGPAEERVDRAYLHGVPAKFSDVYFSLLVNIEGRTLSRSTTLTGGQTNSGSPGACGSRLGKLSDLAPRQRLYGLVSRLYGLSRPQGPGVSAMCSFGRGG